MRGFEYNGDFPNSAQLEKRATLHLANGNAIYNGVTIRVDTACNGDAKQTLLVAETELASHHVAHLDIAGGRIVLKFDGAFYTFHQHDVATNRLVFWPLALPVADVHEGQEHIAKFENEGGLVHPASEDTRVGAQAEIAGSIGHAVSPRYPVSGPSVTRVRPNPNEEGGENWPIGGDRPEVPVGAGQD